MFGHGALRCCPGGCSGTDLVLDCSLVTCSVRDITSKVAAAVGAAGRGVPDGRRKRVRPHGRGTRVAVGPRPPRRPVHRGFEFWAFVHPARRPFYELAANILGFLLVLEGLVRHRDGVHDPRGQRRAGGSGSSSGCSRCSWFAGHRGACFRAARRAGLVSSWRSSEGSPRIIRRALEVRRLSKELSPGRNRHGRRAPSSRTRGLDRSRNGGRRERSGQRSGAELEAEWTAGGGSNSRHGRVPGPSLKRRGLTPSWWCSRVDRLHRHRPHSVGHSDGADTDRYVATVAPLADDPAARRRIRRASRRGRPGTLSDALGALANEKHRGARRPAHDGVKGRCGSGREGGGERCRLGDAEPIRPAAQVLAIICAAIRRRHASSRARCSSTCSHW